MTDVQPSGVDLARAALTAARAAAKTRPTQPQQKRRPTQKASRQRLGDPMSFGTAINRLMTERGWEPPEQGSILDQWPAIAPELDGKVTAVRYEHDNGILHLQPVSPAYATQLRLFHAQILARIQQAPAGRAVRAIRVLAPTSGTDTPSMPPEETKQVETAPPKTRETASAGYRQTLAAALEHRPEHQHADPRIERAIRRQGAALRANRQPEPAVELEQRLARRVDRSEAVRRAALARKRQEAAGLTEPSSVSNVA